MSLKCSTSKWNVFSIRIPAFIGVNQANVCVLLFGCAMIFALKKSFSQKLIIFLKFIKKEFCS